ncbi:CHK domain-containing protein [Aphelenchoides besseyi]|nr:CHK domain-containing protein [Aphelenchoides besseyi]
MNLGLGCAVRGVNLNLYIEPTNVQFSWVIEQLDGKEKRWDKLRKNHKISRIEYNQVYGCGYLTHVFKIIVHFTGGHRFTAFLKVPTIERFRNEEKRSKLLKANQMSEALVLYHNQEIRFYQIIGSRYRGFVLPKIYGYDYSDLDTGMHGRLLLEDVSERGMANTMHDLTIAQVSGRYTIKLLVFKCCAVIEGIAKFHAFSRYTSDSEWIMNSLSKSHLLDLEDDQIQLSTRLAILYEEYFVRNSNALRNLFETAHRQPENPHLRFGIKPVLTHGDLCSSNIFFHTNAKGRPGSQIFTILDWQTCAISTGANDLARFILSSTSAQVQQMCTNRFLKIYYQIFRIELERHGQQIDYCYKKSR